MTMAPTNFSQEIISHGRWVRTTTCSLATKVKKSATSDASFNHRAIHTQKNMLAFVSKLNERKGQNSKRERLNDIYIYRERERESAVEGRGRGRESSKREAQKRIKTEDIEREASK